jgi:hypothetical protein
MGNKLFLIAFGLILFLATSCHNDKGEDLGSLSNKERMQLLKIEDPSIWNTLTTQSIDLGVLETSALKSTKSLHEYPNGGNYYFALFEDLFPSEGDYDFNDVIIKSKLGLSKSWNITGYLKSTLINRGGSLPVDVGLMFYTVSGKTYTRIANEYITVNGEQLTGEDPWRTPLNDLVADSDSWQINFSLSFMGWWSNIWVSYFIYTNEEIFTGGFAPSSVHSFTIPTHDFLTDKNLPWGLEIETDEFAIPNEKELFLNAYPEFEEWAESGGVKNKKWYKSPDPAYTHD